MPGDATPSDLIDVVVRLPRAAIAASLRSTSVTTNTAKGTAYVALATAILASRYQRREIFDGICFGEPCWDMILELYVAAGGGRTINVTKLCAASGKSTTTGLRHLEALEGRGYVTRVADDSDARSTLVIMQPLLRTAVEAWLDYLVDLSGGLET